MGRLTPLRLLWLGLALWGAVHPMVWYLRFMRETGQGLGGVIEAWGANASTVGLSWDLAIAAMAFSLWALSETLARRNWWALIAIPATFGIGLSFGLPLYLFLRSAPVR